MPTPRERVRRGILNYLARGVPHAQKRFDAKTGRFLAENGGWAVTHQDVIYPLALLYRTPGTPHFARKRILELAARGGDALREAQYPDGSFEFIKTDGSRWGRIYMPWSMYHWLEAYVLLRDVLGAARRTRWERGLRLCFTGSARQLPRQQSTHNIPTWHGMALARAGQVLGREDWLRVGTEQVRRSVASQAPDGYWPEGGGPTTSYNLVYVHAVGLYHHFTGDESVLDCLRRALEFHLTFTYPDGSPVETVDGRVKYHQGPSVSGLPGFALFPEGRTYARFLLARLVRGSKSGALSPHLASAWQHFPEGRWADIPQHRESYGSLYHGKALVRRRGPWFVCLSGYLGGARVGTPGGYDWQRWVMDRQNYLSVYHDRLGVAIGGGNSRHQPEFCTFQCWKDGAIRFEAERIELAARGARGDLLRAQYGKEAFELQVRILNERSVRITFRLAGSLSRRAAVRAGFTMRLRPGAQLTWSGHPKGARVDPNATLGISWPQTSKGQRRIVQCRDWRLEMPAQSTLMWPVYPFNPYAINDAAPPQQAVAVVSVPLAKAGEQRSFVLTVRGK